MGLKGGRNIVVREHRFKWKFAHTKVRYVGNSPESGDIIVHSAEGKGRLRAKVVSVEAKAQQFDYEHMILRASLTPKGVAKAIEKAFDDGWDPTARGQHELEGPLDLGDYEVRT